MNWACAQKRTGVMNVGRNVSWKGATWKMKVKIRQKIVIRFYWMSFQEENRHPHT
jgi:hypothetical protein